MNDLNSILLEGTQFGLVFNERNTEALFFLKVKYKDETAIFNVVVKSSSSLFEVTKRNFREDRRVRVVGRLWHSGLENETCIIPEHIEWRQTAIRVNSQEEIDF